MNYVEIDEKALAAQLLTRLASCARDRRATSPEALSEATSAPIDAVLDVLAKLEREGHVEGSRLTMTGLALAVAFDGLRAKPAARRARAVAA